MRRHETKAREKERSEIDKQATKETKKTIEKDEETITKLLAGKVYEKEDIIKVAQTLLPLYKYDYNTQFRIVDKIDNFITCFENVTLEADKPIFAVFGKPKKRWVLFCVIYKDDKKIVLFKDPCGALVSFTLQTKIEETFGIVEFIAQTKQDQKVDDEKSYGPLTIRNLKILLDFLKDGKELTEFSKVKFSQILELINEKFAKVASLTKDLAENEEFKTALKDFIDKLPLDLGSGMLEYKRIMEEELEKGEEEADLERIKQARQKYLTQESVDKITGDYKLNAKEKEEDQVKEYQLEIQNTFPNEMKKLGDIFEVLDDIKVDEKLYKALENISEILEIDYKKMKTFYEFKASLEVKEKVGKLSLGDINNIAQELPQMKESVVSDGTPLDQLLKDVTLGIDQDDSAPNEQTQDEIRKIEAKYHNVKEKYEKWKNTDIHSINTWARKSKGKLGTTDNDVCETIAIMDRALNLITGGHRLRDTQILAVLIFFHGQNNKGRLCQIKTGEGKTVIVSLLAVIRALQGNTVDVITSNPLLAADGVDETKTFYSTFALTVATNNPGESKVCYSADVLYGTISNFQFDFLKDTFEGFNIRNERKFGQVVLDEVDSMLVDNGGHIAKLAAPYPGMECLRYIYIKIWQELHKAEESFVKECQNKIKELLAYPKDEARAKYSKFIGYMIQNERKIIKDKIKASNPTNVPLVPAHLKDYVTSKLDTWIKNALHAKYNCHEHQQYRIMTNDSGERVITPVDYLNTGVTMKNTIWSNGLHQFVQLKHNLYLTFESLTSSFISNIGYIKNYKDKNIFGLTGTLGSRAEQELLSHIYNIDYAKIPTYKSKKFVELPGIVVDDDSWAEQVTVEVLAKVDESRAVLVICETEQDLMSVKKNLQLLQNEDIFRIRTYANEDNADETGEKVKNSDVILATNIAGRGTNFRTEKSLEANGGLHVCVGFLPCNLRVEGQAFGRTSRQGNNGTAQLILRRSEVDELDILDPNPSFTQIKRERDNLERSRLKQINNVLVKELDFKDELFKYFSDFHRNLKREKMTEGYRYVLQDLKEFWAFWLEKKNFKAQTISNTSPQQEFENFLKEARTIIDGTISHNPFYCVGLGDHYLEKDDKAGATRVLNHAIAMGGDQNYELLAGAHMKLFELAILNGHQVRERFKKAVAKIFFINVEKNEGYRHTAKAHLDHARASILKEISYIESCLEEANIDFRKILQQQDENLFLKHIYSRLFCLKVHDGNIGELLGNIESFSGGVDLNGKAPTNIENFLKMSDDPEVKKNLTSCEMAELQSIGVDAIYALKEIHDVPEALIYTSQGQIIGGIAALCIGLAFLPIFPVMSSIAGTLISEGIIDIVMQILTQGATEFDSNDFLKGKFISYGVSLISFGISAITQSVKILSKAVSFCRKLSSFLRKSKYLKGLCNTLANVIDKLGDKLQKMLTVAKFNKLNPADQLDELQKLQKAGNTEVFTKLGGVQKMKSLGKIQHLRKSQVLLKYTGEFAWKTAKQVGSTLIEELVIKPLLNELLQQVIDKIKDHFKNTIRKSIREDSNLMNKLRSTPTHEINYAMDNFMRQNVVLEAAKEVGFELAGLCNNQIIDILTIAADIVYKMTEFGRYNLAFKIFFNRKLNGGNCNNDVDEIIEDICTKLADQMFSLCCDVMKGNFKLIKMGVEYGKKKIESSEEGEDEESPKRKKKVVADDDDDSEDTINNKNSNHKRNLNDDDDPSITKKKSGAQDDDSEKGKDRNRNKESEPIEDIDDSSSKSIKKSDNDEDNDSHSASKSKKKPNGDEAEIDDTSLKPKKKIDQGEDNDDSAPSSKPKKKTDGEETENEDNISNAKKKSDHSDEDEDEDDEPSLKPKKKSDGSESENEDTTKTKKNSEQNEEDNESSQRKKTLYDEESENYDISSPTKKKTDQNEEDVDPSSKKKLDNEESDNETTSSKPKNKFEENDNSDENRNTKPNSGNEKNDELAKKKKKKEKIKKVAQILQDKLLEPLLNAALEECIQQIRESLKNSLKNSIKSNTHLMTKLQTTPYDNINDVLSNFIKGNATFNTAKKLGFKILGVMKNKAITALTAIFDIIKNSVDFGIYISTCASYLEKNLEGGTCDNNVDGIIEQIASQVANHLCKLLKDIGKSHVQIVKISYQWNKEELKKVFNSKEIMKTVANTDTWKEIATILYEEGAFQPLIDTIIDEIKNFFKRELQNSIRSNESLVKKLQTTRVDQINNAVDAFIKGNETFNMAKNISFKLLDLTSNKAITALTTTFNIIKNSIDFSTFFKQFSSFLNSHLQGSDNTNNIEEITETICSKAADQMYFLLKETGKDSIQLGKIGYELKDEDLKNLFFNKDEIFDAVTDKENLKNFGQMLLKEEVFQPLIDKVIGEIKNFFKNTLKDSIRSNDNLVNKLRSSPSADINDVVDTFIREDETFIMAKNISFKLLGLVKNKAITALTTAFEVIKNSIDFSSYLNKFSSYVEEHLHGGDCQNNFDEISENICSKAADQMFALLKATGRDTVQLANITYELKDEDFKKLLNKDEIVSALTNKETWKNIAQDIIKEDVFQPLIDKVVEEIKNSFRNTLKRSIKNNEELLKKINTTPTEQISNILVNFMRGDETLNIAKNISDKISGLVQHKAITALTTTFTIVKNSVDFASYINKLSSYLEENLPGGNCDNNVELITDELCTNSADYMYSLLRDAGKDAAELAMIGYELRNEDLSKLFDKDQIVSAISDKKKWKQIGETIINEEVLQPLINKIEEEIKHSFKNTLKEKIESNDTLIKKLQTTSVDQILTNVYIFMRGDETFNTAKKITDKISGLTKHKAVTVLTTSLTIIKNSIHFGAYIDKFATYLEKHLLGGDCNNNVQEITERISAEAADQMYSLLKETGKNTIKLGKTAYELKNEDLSKLLEKDKLVAAVSDKKKWKEIGLTIIKEEVLQPLMDKALKELKRSFKETLKNSIKGNDNLVKKLQTSSINDINVTVNAFMKGDETFNAVKNISDKISGLVQHKTITALATTFALIKNFVDFDAYINQFSSYLEELLPGGDGANNVEEITEDICSKASDQMCSLLIDSGKDTIEIAKITYELKNEDLTKLFNKDDIVASLTNKEKWKEIGKTIIKEEVLQPLIDKCIEEVKQYFDENLKESIVNNNSLMHKLQFTTVDQINDTVDDYMRGDETLNFAQNISDKMSELVQHNAITALSTILTIIKNSVNFANYMKTFSTYLEEHLSYSNSNNIDVSEIVEKICSKTSDHMFHLLTDTGKDTIKLAKIGYELKNEDLTKLIDKDQIVATLTDKQTWKQIGQTIVKEEILQPLMDKAVEEIQHSLKEKLQKSIRSNDNLINGLHTSPLDKINYVVSVFINGDETFNAAKYTNEKISNLIQHKTVTALTTKTLAIIKNSVDFAAYTKQFVSYLNENLPGGDNDNNIDELIAEICSRAADRMYSLLKDAEKNAVELAELSYNLRNENFGKHVDEDELIFALTDKEKWNQIRKTIIEEELVKPIVDKAIKEIQNLFKQALKKSIQNNNNLMIKLQSTPINQINYTLNVFMRGNKTINTVKNIGDKISGLVQHKSVTVLTSTFTIIKNSVDFADYIIEFLSCLEEHLPGGNCENNLEEITDEICSKASDRMYSLLKDYGKEATQLTKIANELENKDLAKLLDKNQIVAALTDKNTWKQIGQTIVKKEMLQPLIDKAVEDIKKSFKNTLKGSIKNNSNLVKKLQTTLVDQINNTVDDFMNGDETINAVKTVSDKMSEFAQHKTLTALTTIIASFKNSVDFAAYIDKFSPYLEEHLSGGNCKNNVKDIVEEICSKASDRMCSLLEDTRRDTIELITIAYELKNEDLTKLLEQDQIVAALTDKEQWKQIGQTIIKEEVVQPLMDEAAKEIKSSLKNSLKESIARNENLVKKLQTTSIDQINNTTDAFIQHAETINEAKNLIKTLSELVQHKPITVLSNTLAAITNSIDFGNYLNKFSSYLEEHLLCGDFNNNVEEIIDKISSKTADQMYSLLKDIARNTIEIGKFSYELRKEDFDKLLNINQIVSNLTNKEKWKQIGQAIINEEVLQPLINKAVEELKYSFKRTLKKSIHNNSNLLENLQIASIDNIDNIVEVFITKDETFAMIKNITDTISGSIEHKVVTDLPSTLGIIKNSVNFVSYCKKFSSYLEENLPDGNCKNNVEETVEEICFEAADQIYSLLKSTSKDLAIVEYDLINEDLTKLLDKDKIIAVFTGKENWKEIAQTIVEEEILQPLLDTTIEEIKDSYQNILGNAIRSNEVVEYKLQTSQIDDIHKSINILIAGNETLNTARDIGTLMVNLRKNSEVVNIVNTGFDIIKENIDFPKYTIKICSYLEDHLTGGDSSNSVDEIIEEISYKLANHMFSLLTDILRNHKVMGKVLRKMNIENLKKFEFSKELLTISLKKAKVSIVPILEKSISGVTDEYLKALLNSSERKAVEILTPKVLKEINSQAPNLITKENLQTYIEDVVPLLTRKVTNEISKFVYNEDKAVEVIVPQLTKALTTAVSDSLSEVITNADVTKVLTSIDEGVSVDQAIKNIIPHLMQEVTNRVANLISNENLKLISNETEPCNVEHLIQGVVPHLVDEVANKVSELVSNEDGRKILARIQDGTPVDQTMEAIVIHLTEKITDWVTHEDLKAILIRDSLRTVIKAAELNLNQEFAKQIYKFVHEKDIYGVLGLNSDATFDEIVKAIVPYLTPEIVNQVSENLYELRFKDNIYEILGLDFELPLTKAVEVVVAYSVEEIAIQIGITLSEISYKEEIDQLLGVETSAFYKNVIEAIVPHLKKIIFKVLLEAIDNFGRVSLINVVDVIFSYLSHEIATDILTFAFRLSKGEAQHTILNLKYGATLVDIRRQYRKMVLQLHPQQNPEDPEANEKYQKLLQVYHELVKIFELRTDKYKLIITQNLKVLTETPATDDQQ